MVRSEQQRQKKLAAKKKKQRREHKIQAQRKQELASLAGIARAASNGKIIECVLGDSSAHEDKGMVTISLVRSGPQGCVVWACFMVDLWCLGVKDCFAKLLPLAEYYDYVEGMSDQIHVSLIRPEQAHAIVKGGIDYSHSLGLNPHPDCHKIMSIWNGIPVGELPIGWSFGRNGRPCYIVGPFDDIHKQTYIQNVLLETVGEDGFDLITVEDQFADTVELGLLE